ncbi:MAG: hypothetical protein V5A84_01180 [Planctomycetota bacterium]
MSEWLKNQVERLANPIVLKEMYQSLHSKKFLGALWLVLLISLFAYTTIYVSAAGGNSGAQMFGAFAGLSYLMGVAVLPYLGFSTLLQEIRGRTIELVNITTLTSNQHVRGRLYASLVRLMLLYTILVPFAVTAFLFKGIGVQTIVSILYALFMMSVVACAGGIFFGALTSLKRLGTIARWGYLLVIMAFLAMGLSGGSGFAAAGQYWNISLSAEVLGMMAWYGLLAVLVTWLLIAAAANVLTFEADRCWGQTKLIVLLIVLALCAVPWVRRFVRGATVTTMGVLTTQVFAAILLGLAGYVWITEEDRMSQRWRRRLEGRGVFWWLLAYPWMDGPGSTAAFLILPVGVMGGSVAGLAASGSGVDPEALVPAAMVMTYLLFYGTLARGGVLLLPRRYRTSMVVRVCMFGLLAVSMMAAALIISYGVHRDSLTIVSGLCPVLYGWSLEMADPELWSPLVLPLMIGGVYHFGAFVVGLGRHLNERSD